MQVGICSFSVNKSNIFIFAKPTRTVVIRSSSRADGGHTHRPHTLYGLLGIKRSATLAEIRAAYRNAARQLHPDTNASPAAQEDFQRIKAAYEILGDSSLRKLYDNVGLQALGPKFATLWSYLGNGSDDAGAPGDEQRGVRAGPGGGGVRGRDVHLVLGIMLSEAAQGTEKVLSYAAMATCEDCQLLGTRAAVVQSRSGRSHSRGRGAGSGSPSMRGGRCGSLRRTPGRPAGTAGGVSRSQPGTKGPRPA
ncbi:hypothetical protein Vretifemale_15522 [Volvox reticuliferus]|uniref:J domain-containing protein n=1 Tax=Volvox reticuliferus TaxID=1737510 RepID=A0A8J4FRM4_9CHLO|nr:hypothetical protein Vretifemale_15522 [Volvox reticuliferus]